MQCVFLHVPCWQMKQEFKEEKDEKKPLFTNIQQPAYVCIECVVCKRRFHQLDAYIQHRRTHANVYHFYCSICKINVLTSAGFKDHVKTHYGLHTSTLIILCCAQPKNIYLWEKPCIQSGKWKEVLFKLLK